MCGHMGVQWCPYLVKALQNIVTVGGEQQQGVAEVNSFYEGMVTSHIVHEESVWFFRIQDALNWTALD